jgi:SsrA-binding protein
MSTTKEITHNRKAFHDYHILDRIEAGLVLTGGEIKSVRAGQINIRAAYAKIQDGELWLVSAHIAQYQSNPYKHAPERDRKLLVHRDEILKLQGQVSQKGYTIVPLRVYIKDHHAKVELGLAKGKRQYDKRQAIKQRETEREARRSMRRRA